MKCKYCGKEITITDLKCPYCHVSVELELGDEFIDDAILSDAIVSDIAESIARTDSKEEESREALSKEEDSHLRKKSQRKKPKEKRLGFGVKCLIAGGIFVLLLGVIIFIYLHSTDYYLSQAEKYDAASRFDQALSYYEKAYQKDAGNTKVLSGMAGDYRSLGFYADAIAYYQMALSVNPADEDAYIGLIRCYTDTNDEQSLALLKANAPDSMTAVFAQYLVSQPVIQADSSLYSASTDSYKDDLEVTLSSLENADIYFTFDGSDPDETNGTRYTSPLLLTQGTTNLKAVCINSYGQSSSIASETFTVEYTKPDSLSITPPSGQYTEESYIYIDVPDGSHVYYTWDGSTPTAGSSEYTEPLKMIEGNNILSVIIVNSHGLTSDVFRYNYSYLADDN